MNDAKKIEHLESRLATMRKRLSKLAFENRSLNLADTIRDVLEDDAQVAYEAAEE